MVQVNAVYHKFLNKQHLYNGAFQQNQYHKALKHLTQECKHWEHPLFFENKFLHFSISKLYGFLEFTLPEASDHTINHIQHKSGHK